MRALVHSGGGQHGAYGVGIIKHLLGDLKIEYDIYAGVSVGAINSTFLAQYEKGREQEAARKLEELWLTIDNSKVWKYNFPPYIAALWKSSVYSTAPLRKLIDTHFDHSKLLSSGKLLRVGAVSLNSGEYGQWTEQDKDIVDGIMASCAFPGFFETPKVREQSWVDGGVRNVTPLKDAILAGADEIDVILTSRPGIKKVEGDFKTINVLLRSLNIMMDEVIENDIRICQLKNNVEGFRKINLRVFRPSRGLQGGSLDFHPTNAAIEIKLGYQDAQNYKG